MSNIIRFKNLLLLALLGLSMAVSAQTIHISGVVEDTSGPLPGTNVRTKDQSCATITDIDGRFSLDIPKNADLIISNVGYETKTVQTQNKAVLKVFLEESSKELNEIVVIGYGKMKKRDVTGSITSLNEKELLGNKPLNIATALQGKISGLEIVTASEPGSTSDYRIRGSSTLSEEGSTPLFIVDGMEVQNIDNINPQDIASVEVLKDAASAAIYGSRSANGVIIITTKEGSGSKPTISAGYLVRISQLARTLPQMNRRQCIDFDILRVYLQGGTSYSVYVTDSLNPSFSADNYYQDILFQTAFTHQADLSISGSSEKLKYFVSNSYADENGIQINTYNKRATGRINVDYQPTKNLTIGNRLSFSLGNNRKTPSGARTYLLSRPANMALIFDDGTYAPVIASRANPLAYSELCVNNNKFYDVGFNEFLEWKIIHDLSFKTSISGSFYQNNWRYFEPAILTKAEITSSQNKQSTSLMWTHEDVLTYNHTFAKNHNLTAMAGFSLQENSSEYLQLSVTENISEAIKTSAAFNQVNMNSTQHYATSNRLASFFERVGYSYKGKYLINSNVRVDGSSRFGTSKRYGVFPSISAGWRFSDESFFEWAKPVLSDAKIRYSYGTTGNQTAGDFASLSQYSTIAYADYIGIYPIQLENNILGWEETQQKNLGLDISLLNNRISLVFDIYKKETNDVLFNMKLPGTSGFESSYTNVGRISNKGLEFTISTHNIKTKDFDWTTTLNFAFNRNKLFDIPEENVQIANNVYIIDNGYTLGTMWGYKAIQIFSYNQSNTFTPDWQQLNPIFDEKDRFVRYELNGEEYTGEIKQLHYATEKGEVFKGGDVMWDDINHDGVINADDRQIIGCGQPDFIGGFSTDFRWKGLTVSSFFSFSIGGDVINVYEADRNAHIYGTLTQASPVYLAQSWLAPGDVAKYPIPSTNRAVVENTRLASSLWVQDGSYIRLKNLKVAYSLPSKVVKKMKMQDMTFSVMMQDFFTWTNYDGFDPEIKSSGFAIGYDNNSYPRAKSILFGLNIIF